MKNRNLFVLAIVCLLAFPLTAETVKPGKWEVTVETEMAGMPQKIPAKTITHCITEADAKDAESMLKSGGNMSKDCKISDVKTVGDSVTWKIGCPSQGLTGEGSIAFATESYTGTSKMKIGEMQVTQTMKGKRIGECEK